jgi:hypothetical protein
LLNFLTVVALLSQPLSIFSQNSSKPTASKLIIEQPFTVTISAVTPAVEISPDNYSAAPRNRT